MVMIPCPKCGEKISDAANTCIFCGAVLKEAPAKKPVSSIPSSSKPSFYEQNAAFSAPTPPTVVTTHSEDDAIIKDNEKWFGFYVKLPKISMIIIAALFFVWSIVDVAVFKYEIYGGSYYRPEVVQTLYGTMRLPSAFLAMFIWWLIGATVSATTYVILKLTTCYQILHIYNLKKIRENTKKD